MDDAAMAALLKVQERQGKLLTAYDESLKDLIARHNASTDREERQRLRARAAKLSRTIARRQKLAKRERGAALAAWWAAGAREQWRERWEFRDPDGAANGAPFPLTREPLAAESVAVENPFPTKNGMPNYEQLGDFTGRLEEQIARHNAASDPAERKRMRKAAKKLRKEMSAELTRVRLAERRWWIETGEKEYRATWMFDEPPHWCEPYPGPPRAPE